MKLNKLLPIVMWAFLGFFISTQAQAQRQATAIPTVVNGFLVAITVTDGGSGYLTAPTVTITGGNGSGAIAIASINNGAVTQIVVTDSGSGYTATPTVSLSPPPSNRTAKATASVVNGFLVSITVTDGGSGYTAIPTVTISGSSGSGASAVATISSGAVIQIILESAGKGYSTTPIVTISPPTSAHPSFSDGLLAYFPFTGNANDESGMGNNGTPHNAVLVADRFNQTGNAYSFNGANAYVSAPNKNYLTIPNGGDFSLSLWAAVDGNPSTSSYQQWFLCGMDNGSGSSPKWLLFYGPLNVQNWPVGTKCFSFNVIDASGKIYYLATSVFEPQLGSWHQYLITKAGTSYTFYIDGVATSGTNYLITSVATAVPSGPASIASGITAPLTIGWAEKGGFFQGKLDEIRIYNRALSPKEVEDLYNFEAPEMPWVSINVKSVQVTLHVKPTKKYQLQASFDLTTWTNVGQSFIASTSELVQEFDAVETGRYFRLSEVQ